MRSRRKGARGLIGREFWENRKLLEKMRYNEGDRNLRQNIAQIRKLLRLLETCGLQRQEDL
jgi:hypothetical protein